MTRKAPTGKAHAGCMTHVAHDYTRAGWLCITTNTEDVAWPRFAQYTLPAGYDGPTIPAPARDDRPVDRAADMIRFADHLTAVVAQHRAAELERRAVPAYTAADRAIMDPVDDIPGAVHARYPLPASARHDDGARHLPYDSAAECAARAAAAAEWNGSRGRTYTAPPAVIAPIAYPAVEPSELERFAAAMIESGRELGILKTPRELAGDCLAEPIAPAEPAESAAPGSEHVGVRRYGRAWRTFERETDCEIGPEHRTRRDAIAYAHERESTTYTAAPVAEPYDSAAADLAYWRDTPHTARESAGTGRWVDDANGSTLAAVGTCDTCAEPIAYHRDASECSTGGWSHDVETLADALAAFETIAEPAADVAPDPEPAARHLLYVDRPYMTYCAQVPTADSIAAPDHLGALSVLAHDGGWCELCIEYCTRSLEPAPEPTPAREMTERYAYRVTAYASHDDRDAGRIAYDATYSDRGAAMQWRDDATYPIVDVIAEPWRDMSADPDVRVDRVAERAARDARDAALYQAQRVGARTVVDYSASMPDGFTVSDPFGALRSDPAPVVSDVEHDGGITHVHDGGTVHNHAGYAVADMGEPGAAHDHETRDDWTTPAADDAAAHRAELEDARDYSAVTEPAPEPEPAPAPILAAVADPVTAERPTCARCGQVFRKSGAGLAWHVTNRPDCAPVAAPVLTVAV